MLDVLVLLSSDMLGLSSGQTKSKNGKYSSRERQEPQLIVFYEQVFDRARPTPTVQIVTDNNMFSTD